MKKVILAITLAVLLATVFVIPVAADQPDNPGAIGEAVSAQAQAGTRADVVANVKAATPEKNFGQAIQVFKGTCGIPPKHTP